MLEITKTMDINDFEPWSGAVDTYERIEREGKLDELESVLEELYPDGIGETELNDLLWFEDDYIYGLLGIRTESEIREELKEAETELSEISESMEDLRAEYNDECIGLAEWERAELWKDDYADQIADLRKDAKEVNERICELKEELAGI